MHDLVPLEYGQYYYIYNRGNSGENIFIEERNYPYFLGLYVKYIEPIADTFAYVLSRNHFHYWFHLGEAHAIRQLLGHPDLPQFVGDMAAAMSSAKKPTASEKRTHNPEALAPFALAALKQKLPLVFPRARDLPPSPKPRYRSAYRYLGCDNLNEETLETCSPFSVRWSGSSAKRPL